MMMTKGRQAGFWLSAMASLWITACGGGGGGTTTQPPPSKTTPTVTVTPGSNSISAAQALTVTVSVSGGASNPTPTGTVTLSSGTYTSAATTLSSGSASITIPANSLATGAETLTASYTPDASSSSTYNNSSGTASVTVTALIAPTVTVTPGSNSITAAQALTVTIGVSGGGGYSTPTGTVTLSSGTFTSAVTTLVAGSASINVPAGALATGSDSLSAVYTPDAASSSTYKSSSGTASATVTALIAPTVTVTPGSNSITAAQALTVTIGVSGGGGYSTPTGTVTLSSGTFTSAVTTLVAGSASINVPAGALATGSDTLSAVYAPDAASSPFYTGATGTSSVTVTSTTPHVLTINSVGPSSGISITVSPNDNNGNGTGSTPFTRTYYAGTQVTLSAALSANGVSFVSWTGCTSNPIASNCLVNLNADTTVTATYNGTQILSITVTPTTPVTIGVPQQFTATVNGTGNYVKTVTWSVSAPSGSNLSPGDISSAGLYTAPYPAPSSVTVTATSTSNTSISGSATVTLSQPATATGPALSVDLNTPSTPSENPHTISPNVYGMNAFFLDPASAKIANPGLVRWGGDDTSRYNYQNGMTNSASDYYFENFLGAADMLPNASGSTNFTQFVQAATGIAAASLGTVPVLGWVANSTQFACSFTKSAYPNQESYNSNCGNGINTGGTDLFGNSTIAAITSIPETPPDITSFSTPAPGTSSSAMTTWADGTWAGGWVNSLVTNPSFGNGASGKGVALWDLDNEPTWWDAVHRDVHPNPFTYDEVTNNGVGTALAIKTADPTALVSGPVIDNWWAYFYSKQDIENGYKAGPCYEPWSGPTDRQAHAGVPMIEYYLQQFNKYSQSYGVRLLDYLDVHSYFAPGYSPGCSPGNNTVAFCPAGDTQEQQIRMNGTRVFWDPTYTDPNFPQPNYITDANYTANCSTPLQAPQVIPMMQKWVASDYPGTKTGIDEYNFGGLEAINGAVVQADILGIFGRQGLDMSAFWPTATYSTQGPGNYAFAMYRNYDLANDGAMFGDTYLYAASTSSGTDAEGQLAVYGAQRSSDKAITIMVINKTYGSLTSTVSIQNFSAASSTTALVYQYSNANLNTIVAQPAMNVTPPSGSATTSTINYTFPAQSITLFVVPD